MNYELMYINNDPKCKKFGRLDFAKLWNFMVIEGRARVPLRSYLSHAKLWNFMVIERRARLPLRSYLSHTDGQTNKLCVELLP